MRRIRLFGTGGLLSRAQVVLIFMIILLIVALGSVVMIAYINLNTASAFQVRLHNRQSRQRPARNHPTPYGDQPCAARPVEEFRTARSAPCGAGQTDGTRDGRSCYRSKHHRIPQKDDLPAATVRLRRRTPAHQSHPKLNSAVSANQFDSILDLLTRQMQDLYGNEEIQFYTNIGDAINLQRTSQALTIGIGALLLAFRRLPGCVDRAQRKR